jgi:hypothetical protein
MKHFSQMAYLRNDQTNGVWEDQTRCSSIISCVGSSDPSVFVLVERPEAQQRGEEKELKVMRRVSYIHVAGKTPLPTDNHPIQPSFDSKQSSLKYGYFPRAQRFDGFHVTSPHLTSSPESSSRQALCTIYIFLDLLGHSREPFWA